MGVPLLQVPGFFVDKTYLVIFGVPETTSWRASPPLGLDASVRDSALEPGGVTVTKGGTM